MKHLAFAIGLACCSAVSGQRIDLSMLSTDADSSRQDRGSFRAWAAAHPARTDTRWSVEALFVPPGLPAFNQGESVSILRNAFQHTRPDLSTGEVQFRVDEFTYNNNNYPWLLTRAGSTGAVRGLRFGYSGAGVLPVGFSLGVGYMPVAYYARAERRDGSEIALSGQDERVRAFLDHYNELRDVYDWYWAEDPVIGDLAVLPFVEAGVNRRMGSAFGVAAYYRFAPAAAAQILRNHQDFNRTYLDDAPSAVIPSASSILTAQHFSVQARLHVWAMIIGLESAWSIPPMGSWTDRNVNELGATRIPVSQQLGLSVGAAF
jgi:hypothetical protein